MDGFLYLVSASASELENLFEPHAPAPTGKRMNLTNHLDFGVKGCLDEQFYIDAGSYRRIADEASFLRITFGEMALAMTFHPKFRFNEGARLLSIHEDDLVNTAVNIFIRDRYAQLPLGRLLPLYTRKIVSAHYALQRFENLDEDELFERELGIPDERREGYRRREIRAAYDCGIADRSFAQQRLSNETMLLDDEPFLMVRQKLLEPTYVMDNLSEPRLREPFVRQLAKETLGKPDEPLPPDPQPDDLSSLPVQ